MPLDWECLVGHPWDLAYLETADWGLEGLLSEGFEARSVEGLVRLQDVVGGSQLD